MSKRLLPLAATLALISATPTIAESYFEGVPTGWRLQNFMVNDNVAAYYTPSTCASGMVLLPGTVSNDIKNRFWSLIISAKLSNKVVGIYYDPANCHITSFYLKE